MNQVFLSDSCFQYFGTSSATTGAATDADSTPTVVVAEDGTDMGYVPTVTNVATGLYKVEIATTVGNGFEAGRRYNLYAVATVGGVVGRDGIGEFEVLAVDLNTGVASVTGAVGSVTGLNPALLDVAVSTRMETYTQPAGFLAAAFPAIVGDATAANQAVIVAAIDALPDAADNANAVLYTVMTESYRDNGDAPTLAQAQFELISHHGETSITGTTKTIHKVDHVTPACTFTLDSATAPTAIQRAT